MIPHQQYKGSCHRVIFRHAQRLWDLSLPEELALGAANGYFASSINF